MYSTKFELKTSSLTRYVPSLDPSSSTQYYCKFDWEDGSQWFDIYAQLRDKPNCVKKYEWLIIPNGGACWLIEGRPDLVDKCYPWNESSNLLHSKPSVAYL
ncbi:unnamed protein product [Malus baccata var. baccata]